MKNIIFTILILQFAVACNSDKPNYKEAVNNENSSLNTFTSDSPGQNKMTDLQENNASYTTASSLPSSNSEQEKVINYKVQENQTQYNEALNREAETKRNTSNFKNTPCIDLIKKIELAVDRAIFKPEDEKNLDFLYDVNLDQINADCKKDPIYEKKYQLLMQKWDEA